MKAKALYLVLAAAVIGALAYFLLMPMLNGEEEYTEGENTAQLLKDAMEAEPAADSVQDESVDEANTNAMAEDGDAGVMEAEGYALEEERLAQEKAEEAAAIEAQRQAEIEAERLAKLEAERLEKLEAERVARLEAERAAFEAKREAELKAQREAELKAQREAELREQREAKAAAQRAAEARAAKEKAEAERLARVEADAAMKEEADKAEVETASDDGIKFTMEPAPKVSSADGQYTIQLHPWKSSTSRRQSSRGRPQTRSEDDAMFMTDHPFPDAAAMSCEGA